MQVWTGQTGEEEAQSRKTKTLRNISVLHDSRWCVPSIPVYVCLRKAVVLPDMNIKGDQYRTTWFLRMYDNIHCKMHEPKKASYLWSVISNSRPK